MTAPDVTVSVVAGGDAALLVACLRSLPAAAGPLAVETVVVDNASVGAGSALRAAGIDGDVLADGVRRGFGANHNLVLQRARGRYVLVLNDDAEMAPGSLAALAAVLDGNGRAAAAGPRLSYPDGRAQPSAFHFPTPARVALTALTLQRAGWIQSSGDRARRVDWLAGTALMVRRSAALAAGGFDERFFMYSEDVDLCRRLRDEGWWCVYVPTAHVVHHEYGSTADAPLARIHEWARSRALYARTHHGGAGEAVARGAGAAMYALRAAAARVLLALPPERRPARIRPDLPARFIAHARASLRPWSREGIAERARAANERAGIA
jgi:GT2 family glycosyltransferase